jgi:hypothetical protein
VADFDHVEGVTSRRASGNSEGKAAAAFATHGYGHGQEPQSGSQ